MSKTIETSIIIHASKQKIWDILMDFEQYPNWNPFIQSISGERKLGNRIEATIGLGDKGMTFKPRITKLDKHNHFEWLGNLWTKGIFDGRHGFILEEMDSQSTKLIHKEEFKGVLVGILWSMIGDDTEKGFNVMNEALKVRAEE